MLENWLVPPSASLSKDLPDGTLGQAFTTVANADENGLFILGLHPEIANAVRSHLYRMNYHFGKLSITDLGNVRKPQSNFYLPVLENLLSGKQTLVLLGGCSQELLHQFIAYRKQRSKVNVTYLDRMIPLNATAIESILKKHHSRLFSFSGIGYQIHATSADALDLMHRRSYEHLSLGAINANILQAEPLLRDADMAAMSVRAIRSSDLPAQSSPSSIGLLIEDACRLARYCGMSDKLSSFGLYDLDIDHPRFDISAQAVAQILWYFIDGFSSRKGDFPVSTNDMTEYIVSPTNHQETLVFWKSNRSSRWWLQMPDMAHSTEGMEYHRLVPCDYEDYLAASQGHLNDRILNAFSRYQK